MNIHMYLYISIIYIYVPYIHIYIYMYVCIHEPNFIPIESLQNSIYLFHGSLNVADMNGPLTYRNPMCSIKCERQGHI